MNRVLIKRFEPVTKTASGILLQEQGEKNLVGHVIEVIILEKSFRSDLEFMIPTANSSL